MIREERHLVLRKIGGRRRSWSYLSDANDKYKDELAVSSVGVTGPDA